MFQNGQKVVVVSSGDERRVIKVQSASGTPDPSRYPIVDTTGVTGRDQQVQVVSGGDATRFPILRGVSSARDTISALAPLGVWYADQYSATPRPHVPNEMSAGSVDSSLLTDKRRLYSNQQYWTRSSVSAVTDDAVTGPDGLTEASTLTLNANGRILRNITLPAGTYTLALYAKRNTGSDQPFRTSFNFSDNASHTATSAWQRFTHTATVGAGAIDLIPVWTPDAGTTADLQICDVGLFAGSSDLGATAVSGHLYLGTTAYDLVPTVSGGYVELIGRGGLAQFASSTTYSEFTAMTVVSKTAAGSSYQGILSKAQNYQTITLFFERDLAPQIQLSSERYTQAAGLFGLLSDGPHILTHRYTGTVLETYLDDLLIHRVTVTSNQAARDWWIGFVNSFSFGAGCKVNSIVLADAAWTDQEMADARDALTTIASDSSITITSATRLYRAEGDSITAATGTISYAYRFGPNSSPKVYGSVYAVGGSTLSTMSARGTALDATLPSDMTGKTAILSVLIGANDLYSYGGGGAQYATDVATYCDARRTAGWKVVICTVLPRSDGSLTAPQIATHNTERAVYNAEVATWVGVHADAVADFAGDATMGPDAASSDTTYYGDALHPTAAGQALLEPILRAAVNSL